MTMVAEPDVVIELYICPTTGVRGLKTRTTRTETRAPTERPAALQVWLVHDPVGAEAASQLVKSSDAEMDPNGVTIRLAAASTSARNAARFGGHTGPPG
jgi:hypothetical protein